jgi:lipase
VDVEGKTHDIEVADGTLRVLSWGTGPRTAIAVHGITGNAMSWRAVARALPQDSTLYAVDLRGRGHSAELPGPYGFDQHNDDLRRVALALGLDRPALVGHSLGAYIALLAADAHPQTFGALLLVDGGLPLPVPPDADLDELLATSLGPALARLSERYPSPEAYVQFWQAHPAFTETWTSDVEQYVRYDLTGEPGSLRSRVVLEAARVDGRALLSSGERIATALGRRHGPTPLLRATSGMFGQPPGLIPDQLVSHWQTRLPTLAVETIPQTNHYSIMFDPVAAQTIAAHLVHATARTSPM